MSFQSVTQAKARCLTPSTVYGTGIAHPRGLVVLGDLEGQFRNFNSAKAGGSFEDFAQRRLGGETVFADVEGKGLAPIMARAARMAIKNSKLDIGDIGLVVVVTSCPNDLIAGVRGLVLEELGITEMPALEINGACTGFMDGLSTAGAIAMTTGQKILLVAGDLFRTRYVDPSDYLTNGLFGDGAAAAVLGPAETGFGIKIGCSLTNAKWRSDGCMGPDKFFKMNAQTIGERIPSTFSQQFLLGCSANGFEPRHTIAIPHQANGRLLRRFQDLVNIPAENVVNVFHKFGNCSAASIGIALHHAFVDGQLGRGIDGVLFGAGAGFNYGYLGITGDRSLIERKKFPLIIVSESSGSSVNTTENLHRFADHDPKFHSLFEISTVAADSVDRALALISSDSNLKLVICTQKMDRLFTTSLHKVIGRHSMNIGYVVLGEKDDNFVQKTEKVGFSECCTTPNDPRNLWKIVIRAAIALRNRDIDFHGVKCSHCEL